MTQITISKRFNGPPDSGNGGYCCGVLAEAVDGAADVRLMSPPPLERALSLESGDTVRMLDGEVLVGEARTTELELAPPPPPSLEEAAEWAKRYRGFEDHAFPTCFVCGPERAAGDGMQIFPGRGSKPGLVACPWTPDASLGGENGKVRRAFLWAALDCPGYFGAADGRFALLGRMQGDVRDDVPIGEPCIIVGWRIGIEGRKIHAGTALFTRDGELLGRARQTWIEPKAMKS